MVKISNQTEEHLTGFLESLQVIRRDTFDDLKDEIPDLVDKQYVMRLVIDNIGLESFKDTFDEYQVYIKSGLFTKDEIVSFCYDSSKQFEQVFDYVFIPKLQFDNLEINEYFDLLEFVHYNCLDFLILIFSSLSDKIDNNTDFHVLIDVEQKQIEKLINLYSKTVTNKLISNFLLSYQNVIDWFKKKVASYSNEIKIEIFYNKK